MVVTVQWSTSQALGGTVLITDPTQPGSTPVWNKADIRTREIGARWGGGGCTDSTSMRFTEVKLRPTKVPRLRLQGNQ